MVETTHVKIIPLHLVEDDVARDEGEGFGDAGEWRRNHVGFWNEVADLVRADAGDPSWQLREAEPVVVHWFRLVASALAPTLTEPELAWARAPKPPGTTNGWPG